MRTYPLRYRIHQTIVSSLRRQCGVWWTEGRGELSAVLCGDPTGAGLLTQIWRGAVAVTRSPQLGLCAVRPSIHGTKPSPNSMI
jgi:hypothetical protein